MCENRSPSLGFSKKNDFNYIFRELKGAQNDEVLTFLTLLDLFYHERMS